MAVYLDDVIDGMERTSPSCEMLINVQTSALLEFRDWNMYEDEDGDAELANFRMHEEDYAVLPSSFDIREYQIMEQFVTTIADNDRADTLWMAVDGPGAFRRFKDAITRFGIRDRWFAFREQRFLAMAKYWCADNDLDYTFKHPEHILSRRKLMDVDPPDVLAEDGDVILQNGIFRFNITQLLENISCHPWDIDDFELVGLKVEDWLDDSEDTTRNEAAEDDAREDDGVILYDSALLLEISPDRRLVTPDDPFALQNCCNLVDGDRKLRAAKRAGLDTLNAYLIPMEVHEACICSSRAAYTEYWNSKIDDAIHDIKHMQPQAD